MTKSIPAGLLAHLQNDTTSTCTCWKVTLQGGSPPTVYGFTDHDEPLVIDGVTYLARSGFLPTAYENQTKMAVDNLNAQGFIDNDVIDEQDLLNGLWDFAEVEIFQVNWNDLSAGKDILTKGHLGQISVERGRFESELRGLANAFTQTRNILYTPTCRVEFGSTECGVNLTPYTFTGTLTSVASDGLRIFDTARTEAGPSGVAITAITKAASAVVTSNAHGLTAGNLVFFHSVSGMTEINGLYGLISSASTNTFTVAINSTNFSTYTTGGVAASLGSAGYFAAGKITMTSGASAGLSMEVKESGSSLILLQLQFPTGVAAGDTYSIVRGCTKRFNEDCYSKFNNAANFRGHPHVPGLNKMIQGGAKV